MRRFSNKKRKLKNLPVYSISRIRIKRAAHLRRTNPYLVQNRRDTITLLLVLNTAGANPGKVANGISSYQIHITSLGLIGTQAMAPEDHLALGRRVAPEYSAAPSSGSWPLPTGPLGCLSRWPPSRSRCWGAIFL
jgi:hypothetical protein